ncbi:MAG TPA: hypothetical protein DCM05_03310 [Elusimicrobia bacterium]|nr:hypothetical protein [Elusimicrobiota bacterium]
MKHKTAIFAAFALAATAWMLNAYAGPTRIDPDAQAQVARAMQAAVAADGLPTPPPAAPAPEEPKTVSFHIDPALVKPAPELAQAAEPAPCAARTEPAGEALLQAPGQPIDAGCAGN